MAKTVLIVEDERAIVEILKFNLKREGYETLEALDGETGLLLAQTKDPDLILLDVMLPKMNGFDICKTLRAENRTTPIIMLTAREEEMDKVFGLETGADDYMTKPFSMKELMARVKANIRRRSMEYTPGHARPGGQHRRSRRSGPQPGDLSGDEKRRAGRPDAEGIRPAQLSHPRARQGLLPRGSDAARVEL